MFPFDPLEHFFAPNHYCFTCDYDKRGSCRASDPAQCPNALNAAFHYLTSYLTSEEVEDFLRFSLGDDLLAASMAQKAGVSLEDGCRLFEAFQFWSTGLRS